MYKNQYSVLISNAVDKLLILFSNNTLYDYVAKYQYFIYTHRHTVSFNEYALFTCDTAQFVTVFALRPTRFESRFHHNEPR
jgi:hypothetical protein